MFVQPKGNSYVEQTTSRGVLRNEADAEAEVETPVRRGGPDAERRPAADGAAAATSAAVHAVRATG